MVSCQTIIHRFGSRISLQPLAPEITALTVTDMSTKLHMAIQACNSAPFLYESTKYILVDYVFSFCHYLMQEPQQDPCWLFMWPPKAEQPSKVCRMGCQGTPGQPTSCTKAVHQWHGASSGTRHMTSSPHHGSNGSGTPVATQQQHSIISSW